MRVIRGVSIAPKSKAPPGANAPKRISSAQTTYPSISEHFANLIEASRTIPNFSPPEEKFKLSTRDAFVASLRQANTDVNAADAETWTARQIRDALLYTGVNGVIQCDESRETLNSFDYRRGKFGLQNLNRLQV